MNLRSSTSILSSVKRAPTADTTKSLRRRLVFFGGLAAAILVGGVGMTGLFALRRTTLSDADTRIAHSATLSKELIDRVLAERSRQVEMIAAEPLVIAAAEKGAVEALKEKLPAKL